jgi:hydrogenase expression/formation protein HypC
MCLAVPGRIVSLATEAAGPCARVDFAGVEKQVSLAFVPEARVGEYVLVHVGFAIAQVDEAEARRVFEYLREIDALAGELGP